MVRRYALRMLTISQSAQALFIAITVLVNVVVLGRSYVTMLVLDFGELGLVALLQSIILLVGTLQFGFHQGGYRLICSADADEARRINNLVYSYSVLVGIGAILVACATLPFADTTETRIFVVLGAVGGAFTLLRNWLNNQMIALRMLKPLNHTNMWSAIGSLTPFAFVGTYPLAACVASVVLQPALGIAFAMYRYPQLRPNAVNTSLTLMKAILSIGFIMFCASLLIQLTLQVERWYVVSILGVESLGHLYLAILFLSLFQIVPNAVNAIFLPKLVKANDTNEFDYVSRLLRQLFLVMAAYCFICSVMVYTLAPIILSFILPKYVSDLEYVRIIVIGLSAFTILGVFAISFDILMRYRPYLVSYGLGLVFMAAVFGTALATGHRLDLAEVSWIKSFAYIGMGLLLAVQFYWITRGRQGFRFRLFPRAEEQ